LLLKIDEVAERILTLGFAPEHNYSKYAQVAGIKESTKVTEGIKSVEQVLEAFKIVILMQRKILLLAADANDEGTNALMSDYIRLQEKQVWMYSAFLIK
jgi:starvation-inducible DNA-binding protein